MRRQLERQRDWDELRETGRNRNMVMKNRGEKKEKASINEKTQKKRVFAKERKYRCVVYLIIFYVWCNSIIQTIGIDSLL